MSAVSKFQYLDDGRPPLRIPSLEPPKRSLLRRMYTTLRRLVRRRQDSSTVRTIRRESAREVADLTTKVSVRDQQIRRLIDDYDFRISEKEKVIRELQELDIPKLKRQLEVATRYTSQLEQLIDNRLVLTEMLIAINNQKIVEADSPVSTNQADAVRRLLRGDMGVQHGE
jgi:hypothetical protein